MMHINKITFVPEPLLDHDVEYNLKITTLHTK